MTKPHEAHDFEYLGYEGMVGGKPQYPDTIYLLLPDDQIAGFLAKLVRAVRDDVRLSHTTIPLRGRLTPRQSP